MPTAALMQNSMLDATDAVTVDPATRVAQQLCEILCITLLVEGEPVKTELSTFT